MITVLSGLPGAGKTLYTIWFVLAYIEEEYKAAIAEAEKAGKDLAFVERRPVYYRGIKNLQLPWIEMSDDECKEWYKLPVGAIIVVDEAQKIWPAMANSAKRPMHYTEVDEHRHRGYDLFLVTQDPVNIDQRPRSMAERHLHVSRSFGVSATTVYEFQGVQYVTGGKYKKIEGGQKRQWKFPKEVYEYYKSAEVHTHKARLPVRKLVFLFAPAVVLLPLFIWGITSFKNSRIYSGTKSVSDTAGGSKTTPVNTGPTQYQNNGFIAQNQKNPLIKGDVLTIPMFQHLISVKSYQRIDGCALSVFNKLEVCRCNDQRGNTVPVTHAICKSYIVDGYFDYTITDEQYAKLYNKGDVAAERVPRSGPTEFNPFENKGG